nr:hypothetical protein CFP56_20636 [Quercus suber]
MGCEWSKRSEGFQVDRLLLPVAQSGLSLLLLGMCCTRWDCTCTGGELAGGTFSYSSQSRPGAGVSALGLAAGLRGRADHVLQSNLGRENETHRSRIWIRRSLTGNT